jgi:hypothetical protein
VNGSEILLGDWGWMELVYDFIKFWTWGLVTMSLLCPLERILKRDNHSMKGDCKKCSAKRIKLALYKSKYESNRNVSEGRWCYGLSTLRVLNRLECRVKSLICDPKVFEFLTSYVKAGYFVSIII